MIIDRAARHARDDRSTQPRLARALLSAVAAQAVCEPPIANAVGNVTEPAGRRRPAQVKTAEGTVTVRSTHPSVVLLDLPCDPEAGLLFRERAARGAAALGDAVNAVESANMPIAAMRGALAACAEVWPRKILRAPSTILGPIAAAAVPFVQSVRCDGLGVGADGPTVSLRLLDEADDRPLQWSAAKLGPSPGRIGPPDPAAFAAPFVELFADPVFRRRFEAAAHRAFRAPVRTDANFAFGDTRFSVSIDWEGLALASFIDVHPWGSTRALWMVQQQLADPRVGLRARLSLALADRHHSHADAVTSQVAKAARAAGIGDVEGIEIWHFGSTQMKIRFKVPG